MHAGLNAGGWEKAPFTEDFVDIEGSVRPQPAYRTRVKMMWDDRNLYVAAELQDPDVWATLLTHDQIIFHDNDFEVFIDPDSDCREYYEIEVNALGTVFDLFLHQTYIAGGPAVHGWDAAGLKVDVLVNGLLNNPRALDQGWLVQMTVPWSALQPPQNAPELRGKSGHGDATRRGAAPGVNEVWRINFSRVQWRHNYEVLDQNNQRVGPASDALRNPPPQASGAPVTPAPYAKVPNLPEDNWVWSPQWAVNMHLPQYWGRVTFVR